LFRESDDRERERNRKRETHGGAERLAVTEQLVLP